MDYNETALIQSLDKVGVKGTFQAENNQIFATLALNGYDYPLFIRLLPGGHLMQVITFVPCNIEEGALTDVCRLLHMINKELDMPGFCCDEESKTVFYRLVLPCLQKKVDEELFHAFVNTTKQVCTMFGTVVQAIAVKAMSLEEMLEKAKNLAKTGAPKEKSVVG